MPETPVVADAHSDLLIELAYAADEFGEVNPLGTRWLPPLERGNVGLQVCAIFVEPEYAAEDRLRRALRLAHAFRAGVRENTGRAIAVQARQDLDRIGEGQTGLLLSVEGLDFLGEDPWLIDAFASLGVRMASLTWNGDNAFAGGADGALGLTDLGAELIARMARLGVVVDLAHASERTFWDVLGGGHDAELLVSHAACRALRDHPRNLHDDQLAALAERGGILGVMPHPLVLDPEHPTIASLLEHVDHAVAVMGIEHVGLGGDFMPQIAHALGLTSLPIPDDLAPDAALDGLAGPEDYPALASALRAHGYDEASVAAIFGGNLLNMLRRTLAPE